MDGLFEAHCIFCGKIIYRLVHGKDERLWCVCHNCIHDCVILKKKDGGLVVIHGEDKAAFAEKTIAS